MNADTATLQRISEMENCLNACSAVTADLCAQLDRMAALKEPMTRLFAYYGSEAWFEDRDLTLPQGFPAGVLSEDAVYSEITAVREAALQMLELAAEILRDRI